MYGSELIIDLKGCDVSKFTREHIEEYMIALCDLIDMERETLLFWDDLDVPEEERETEPHLKGTSAVQWITTSNVVIHTLDLVGEVYINIHSCKAYNERDAAWFSREFFGGVFQLCNAPNGYRIIARGLESKV